MQLFYRLDAVKGTYAEPVDNVRVGGRAGAAGVLLVTGGADDDGVVEGARARGVQRPHVENVDALHLSEDLEALDTGGLLKVGGDGARGGAWADEVIDRLYVCGLSLVSFHLLFCASIPLLIRSCVSGSIELRGLGLKKTAYRRESESSAEASGAP